VVSFEAVQARSDAGFDDGADARAGVAEHDGKVG